MVVKLMEISRVGRSTQINTESKKVANRKGFSQSFSFAHQRKSQEQLKKMLEDIKKKGNRLAITK